MKSRTMGIAALALLAASCASPAGIWNDSFDAMDPAALRAAMEKSLRDDQWTMADKGDLLVAVKKDGGGHQTAAEITISAAGSGASYSLLGKSDHVVNWLSFGILGATTKVKAEHTCAQFVETFQAEHARAK